MGCSGSKTKQFGLSLEELWHRDFVVPVAITAVCEFLMTKGHLKEKDVFRKTGTEYWDPKVSKEVRLVIYSCVVATSVPQQKDLHFPQGINKLNFHQVHKRRIMCILWGVTRSLIHTTYF
jgi:hypothetical protein